jgi:hypothetical protein
LFPERVWQGRVSKKTERGNEDRRTTTTTTPTTTIEKLSCNEQ